MFPLHDIVFPASSDRHENLYLKAIGGVALGTPGAIRLEPRQGLSTATYFGGFPWQQWRELAALHSVHLRLRGAGLFTVVVKTLTDSDETDVVVLSQDLSFDGEILLDLSPALEACLSPVVFFELTARSQALVEAITICTDLAPRRSVTLGLVITTFGRADVVRGTIAKLERILEGDSEREFGALRIVIVDNGGDLDTAVGSNTTVLTNPNLGGAGGFARGLSHLSNDPGMSHACFMDDDAATEGECLFRCRRLLAYARDERTAVSGAMLRSEVSFMMHEQGAIIEWGRNHRIISRKNGLNLIERPALRKVFQPDRVEYGGWWFFAFPIRGDLRYPYPMFVRGDDWLFSYLNSFQIATMPGICSWQEGFEHKIGPVEQYLAFKAFLVAEIILRQPTSRLKTIFFFAAWIARNAFGYCYDRAQMNCAAFSDVLEGPSFWEKNVSLGPRLALLRGEIETERLQDVPETGVAAFAHLARPESIFKKLLRNMSFNGHVVPLAVLARLRKSPLTVAFVEAPRPVFTFLRPAIFYKDPQRSRTFVAVRDARRCFHLLWRGSRLCLRLFVGYRRLRTDYLRSIDGICTQGWWDRAIAQASGRARH